VKVFDREGGAAIKLVKARAPEGSDAARYEVDALAGATLTTRGVQNLVRFWTGELGFRSFLNNLKATS
jgi:Na+-transporting NADH:ubiquinone oxidoreductase subunit C